MFGQAFSFIWKPPRKITLKILNWIPTGRRKRGRQD
jgi:hypothetical protein